MNRTTFFSVTCLLLIGLALAFPKVSVGAVSHQQVDDPVQQGEYLVSVAGCPTCHTPLKDPATELIDDAQYLAGGREFDLGPLGILQSRNLTSDVETGLGAWSDEEIKTAIRSGVDREGDRLFPIMPFRLYANMAESDLDAIVAYLRTVPAISNPIPDIHIPQVQSMPPISYEKGLTAPAPTDTVARGDYLFNAILPCTDCHTPVNPATGEVESERYLAGGQPFEGAWGVVYSANLTPHEKTGIGTWSDLDIRRVLAAGVRPDGRRVILMPWRDYQNLTPDDVNAVIAYLRRQKAVNNEVPEPSLNEGYLQFVKIANTESTPTSRLPLWSGLAVALLLIGIGVRRQRAKKKETAV